MYGAVHPETEDPISTYRLQSSATLPVVNPSIRAHSDHFSQLCPSREFSVFFVTGWRHVPAHYESTFKELHLQSTPARILLLQTYAFSYASTEDLEPTKLASLQPFEPYPHTYAVARVINNKLFQPVEASHAVLLLAHSYGGLSPSKALCPSFSSFKKGKRWKAGRRDRVLQHCVLATI